MGQEDLQLLRDVVTRWSSTLLMIERGLKLKDVFTFILVMICVNSGIQGIVAFLEDPDFSELLKFQLDEVDWEALEIFEEILQVQLHHDLIHFY